ncbi:hypothetical protein EGW08_010469 [Elysia chlorotica]|uniref:Uncharacterized protein n=1 Tax=Elysia chlorotica TaxID=188477 RepID=A0A3S1HL82_ELYCH|nr:hypothetical protein EGW08_010469 [Elysia chlorotica]
MWHVFLRFVLMTCLKMGSLWWRLEQAIQLVHSPPPYVSWQAGTMTELEFNFCIYRANFLYHRQGIVTSWIALWLSVQHSTLLVSMSRPLLGGACVDLCEFRKDHVKISGLSSGITLLMCITLNTKLRFVEDSYPYTVSKATEPEVWCKLPTTIPDSPGCTSVSTLLVLAQPSRQTLSALSSPWFQEGCILLLFQISGLSSRITLLMCITLNTKLRFVEDSYP